MTLVHRKLQGGGNVTTQQSRRDVAEVKSLTGLSAFSVKEIRR